jgi:peptidoglycan/LPS O-acetylase OafA/YrhL
MYNYNLLAGNRIFGLDLVRSIAVCAVVFAHSGYEYIGGFRYGVIAIEYFFVMSGFLVGEMLIKEFKNGSDLKILFNFWIKRWFRTLPLYYLILILKIILSEPFIGLKVWPYFLFLQNNIGGISFFAVSWTLVIEEWFYLIMPLLIYLFFNKGIENKKFIFFTSLIILFQIIARIIYVEYKDVPWGGIVGSFPFRLDSFMIGVFVAFLKVQYSRVFFYISQKKVFALATILLIIYIIIYNFSLGGVLSSKVYWTRTFGFTITSVLLSMQLPFLSTNTFLNSLENKNMFRKIFTWISLLSYPIYLIHMDILYFVRDVLPDTSDIYQLIICYSIILTISYFLIVFFHQPVTDLRKKFLLK